MTPAALERTAKTLRVWQANPEMKLKDLSLKDFQAQHDRMVFLNPKIKLMEEELTPLRNERNALETTLEKNATRVKTAIAGYFGADSDEYELAGGTRASERKKSGPRKTKTNATTTAAASAK